MVRLKSEAGFESKSSQDQIANRIPVAVVGARGYSGLELSRLLLRHSQARLAACFATAGFKLADYLPEAAAATVTGRAMEDILPMVQAGELKTVFLATPAEVSLELAPRLLEFGVNVIDLSGAFRLSQGSSDDVQESYRRWYQIDHPSPALVKGAVYGLQPFVEFQKGGEPILVANPGCFATAVLLALVPILRSGLVEISSLSIDAKSGTTGAGRKAQERLLHAEVDGLCIPYRIGRHQHLPEISQAVGALTNQTIDPHFTTHLIGVRRGIIAGVYARTMPGVRIEAIRDAYAAAYGSDALIRVEELTNENEEKVLSLRKVVGSARAQIGYRLVNDKLYVFSLIDNLMKGAASQAVENFNRISGLPVSTGLAEVEGVL